MEIWAGGYMAVGLIWSLWNSKSRYFQAVAANANRHGISWAVLVGFIIGVLIWPVGVIGALVLKSKGTRFHR